MHHTALPQETARPPSTIGGEWPDSPARTAEDFCRALKTARERRGLKLTDIAESTKVCVTYYLALERNDLQRWPKGIFRRSFFRGYVTAIGLPAEETIDEFCRLFPEDTGASATLTEATPPPLDSSCRLALDLSWHGPTAPAGQRIISAVLDASFVIAASLAIAWLGRGDLTTAIAATTVTYFTLSTLLWGTTPAALRHRWRWPAMPVKGLDLAKGWLAKADGDAAGQADSGEPRPWKSDARRVRPRESARLRVRFRSSA